MVSRQKFAIWLFLFSGALFVWLFYIFLKPFIVASLLLLATLEFGRRLDMRFEQSGYRLLSENKELLSASVLTLVFGAFVFVPAAYFIVYAVNDILKMEASDIFALKAKIESLTADNSFLNDYLKSKITEYLELLFSEEFLVAEAKNIFSGIGGFLSGFATSFVELAMVVIFFFLLHWFKNDIGRFVKTIVPMDEKEKEVMSKEIISAISIVFLTLLGVMAAQGFAFFVLMLFFDYNAVMLGFLSGISSVVPIFGTALVWVPVALSEFMKGNIVNAVIISFYSWFVMAFLIDNFLRLFLLNKVGKLLKTDYKINEFLLFFSIAAGIAAFGFWGFIIGPSITALFLSSARVFKNKTY